MCVISFFFKNGHEGKRRNPRNVIRPDPGGVVGGGTLIGRLRNWTTSLSFWWMGSISERDNDI